MGFELRAFLGRASDLRAWKRELPAAVVCVLSGELVIVPATYALAGQLRARFGKDGPHEHWAARASAIALQACVSAVAMGVGLDLEQALERRKQARRVGGGGGHPWGNAASCL